MLPLAFAVMFPIIDSDLSLGILRKSRIISSSQLNFNPQFNRIYKGKVMYSQVLGLGFGPLLEAMVQLTTACSTKQHVSINALWIDSVHEDFSQR